MSKVEPIGIVVVFPNCSVPIDDELDDMYTHPMPFDELLTMVSVVEPVWGPVGPGASTTTQFEKRAATQVNAQTSKPVFFMGHPLVNF
jgi:hypothetical protein